MMEIPQAEKKHEVDGKKDGINYVSLNSMIYLMKIKKISLLCSYFMITKNGDYNLFIEFSESAKKKHSFKNKTDMKYIKGNKKKISKFKS
jgi:hypothetical protein